MSHLIRPALDAGALLARVPTGLRLDSLVHSDGTGVTTTINFSDLRVGGGKTLAVADALARNEDRHVLVVDRRDVIATRVALIQQFAAVHGTTPHIEAIYSRSDAHPDGSANVCWRVRAAGADLRRHRHVIVVMTHAALQSSDLSTFRDWNLFIDEVPQAWTHHSVKTPATARFLAANYNLIPVPGREGWSRMQPKVTAPSTAAYARDDYMRDLAVLHQRAKAGSLVAHLTDWSEAAGDDGWNWYSLWTGETLSAFRRVVLVANAVESSLFYQTAQAHGAVRFAPFHLVNEAPYRSRTMLVEYFADEHRAGRRFWTESDQGKACIARVAEWLASHSPDARQHYISYNGYHANSFAAVPGLHVRPRIAGVNSLASMTCGTFLYSGKFSRQEQAALACFGIDHEQAVRSREGEDILQMSTRGCLRVDHDDRPFTFRVYDRAQAEALRSAIDGLGLPISVELRHIDIGLDEIGCPKPGPKPKYGSGAERAEAIRAQNRESKRRRRAAKKTVEKAAYTKRLDR